MFEVMMFLGFFVLMLLAGISLLGVIVVLAVFSILFWLFGGLFVLAIKVLPWLALILVAVWYGCIAPGRNRNNLVNDGRLGVGRGAPIFVMTRTFSLHPRLY
ncbi:envelope stress response protein PspG [Edwardsiella tarda]|uniref:envelope stress response protein PspG n=1 Tax=Edwardsiella tarda TaxID=636 RepID=UPI003F657E96